MNAALTFQQCQEQSQPGARDDSLPIPIPKARRPFAIAIAIAVADCSPKQARIRYRCCHAHTPRRRYVTTHPVSTHRRSHSVSQSPGVPRGLGCMFDGGGGGGGTGVNEHGELRVSVYPNVNGRERPRTARPELTTFSERVRTSRRRSVTPRLVLLPEVILSPVTPPMSAGSSPVRRFGNLLAGGGRNRGSGDRTSKKTSILGSFGSQRPSADMGHGDRRVKSSPPDEKSERPSTSAPTSPAAGEATVSAAGGDGNVEMHVSPTGGIAHSQTQPLQRRAATILDPQGYAKRHERRSSTGGT